MGGGSELLGERSGLYAQRRGTSGFIRHSRHRPDRPCRLTSARYANELPGYAPPSLELESAGYGAPQLIGLANQPLSFLMSRNGSQSWRLVEEGVVGDPRLPDGAPCEEFSGCSSAQLVELGEANEQGVRPVIRVLKDAIPLELHQDDGAGYFMVRVPHLWMGAGRWLGLRLVANRVAGRELQVSSPVAFYAQPPFHWVGPGAGGTGGEVQILPPEDGANGNVVIEGGHRIDVDSDGALEIVVCGKDVRGKVFAVVEVNVDGTLPEAPIRAQRSSFEAACLRTSTTCLLGGEMPAAGRFE